MDWLLIVLAVTCGAGVGWGRLPARLRRLPRLVAGKPYARRRHRRRYPTGR